MTKEQEKEQRNWEIWIRGSPKEGVKSMCSFCESCSRGSHSLIACLWRVVGNDDAGHEYQL